jgi:hypothetical protein
VEGHAFVQSSAPNVQQIVERTVDFAVAHEDANAAWFNSHYKYTRMQTWMHHNEAGKLTSSKQTQTEENSPLAATGVAPSSAKGLELHLKSYPVTNIVARFDFALMGEDTVNGRPAYVIEFAPRKKLPVLQLYDPLINQATGKLWVDEQDYAIAKAQFRLMPPIRIAHGLVGEIDAFTCTISRSRTIEGLWFVRGMNWHLDGRLITIRRVIDYYEERVHPLPITTLPHHTG